MNYRVKSETELPGGLKRVVISMPELKPMNMETLRMRAPRTKIQNLIIAAVSDHENVFRNILAAVHGEQAVNLLAFIFSMEGPESPDAERLLGTFLIDFQMHSPTGMFLHYLHADNLARALDCYEQGRMQGDFLCAVGGARGKPIATAMPADRADNFDFLCESLGLAYRSDREITVFKDPRRIKPCKGYEDNHA